MEGPYGATRETDSLPPSFGYFTSFSEKSIKKTGCEKEPWHSRKIPSRTLCLVSYPVHDLMVAMILMVGLKKIVQHFSFAMILR